MDLERYLVRLPVDDLDLAIAALERLVRSLHHQRDERRERKLARDRSKRARRRRNNAVDVLGNYLHQGMSEDQALRIVAQMTGIALEQLAAMAPRARRIADRVALFDRNRKIMEFARRGLTNVQIAEKISVDGLGTISAAHVGRIINQNKKQ